MDSFHTPVCSYQGGSFYQGMHQNYVLPKIQPSHQNYALAQNVSQSAPVIISNTYQLPNWNCSNQITLPGHNKPVKILPYLNQGTNCMPVIVNNTNSISYNYNGQAFPIQNSQASQLCIIPRSQASQVQKINVGTSTANTSWITNDKTEMISKNVGKGESSNGKKSEGTNTSTEGIKGSEKIGNVSMDIIQVFPLHNIHLSRILDLNFLGFFYEIKNLNLSLHDKRTCKGKFLDVLQGIIRNNTLLHWFILKCEERQISVCQKNFYVELYSVDDYSTLFQAIDEESCLPLPYITKGVGNKKRYFYINLAKSSYNKVMKLNSCILGDYNENKKIICNDPGIKLHCTFSETIKDFTINVHESAMPLYRSSTIEIRQLVIYKHVVWGFLQSWVRRVKKHFKDFFTEEQISKNLSLQQMGTLDGEIILESENIPIYTIGFSNFYLKFDPVNSSQARDSFSVKNFETKFACDISVVQYYRQFFFLHGVRSMRVLNYVVWFFDKRRERNGHIKRDQNSSKNKTLERGEEGSTAPSVPGKNRMVRGRHRDERIDLPSSSSGAIFSVSRTNEETPGSYFDWHTSHERGEDSVGNQKNGNATEPREETVVGTLQTPFVRPLLKTRTVEEINSSIEANKRLGFYPISFDSVGKFGVGARDQSNQENFATLVREVLESCYSVNALEMTALDETNDEDVISKRFKEALDGAMGTTSLESFIGAIYVSLQVHFTNSTSRKILNTMIKRAMEKKYPGFESIVTGSRSAVQTCVDKPSGKHKTRLLEIVREALVAEQSSLGLTKKTAPESGNSCVPSNLPVQAPQRYENLQDTLPKKEVVQEQEKVMKVETCASEPSENAESGNGVVLSKEKETSGAEPSFSVTVKKEKVEGAEPSLPGGDALPSSKDENESTFDNKVEYACKTEVPHYPTGTGAGGKAPEEESISPRCENTRSEPTRTEPEIKMEQGAETSETSEADSEQRPVKLNAHNIRKFNTSCEEEEEEKEIQRKPGAPNSLQPSREMKELVVVENNCEPKRKRRRMNDSDVRNNEIRVRTVERLRKRSRVAVACRKKSQTEEEQNEIAKDSRKKFGDCEETKKNVFSHRKGFKKELKILIRRLEDMPEYKKYAEDYWPDLQFKVKQVRHKNKDRPEGFKIVGIKRLTSQYGSWKRKTNRK